MKLEVIRFSHGSDSTSGLLFVIEDGVREFLCYTLEDEYRDTKLYGETRIPNGTYRISLRNEGGYHARYAKRFKAIHKGMLHITNVPNFEYILIHCGNTDEHTAGCLLLGDTQTNNMVQKDGFVGQSTSAYKRVYPRIAEMVERFGSIEITYKNI